MRDRGTRLTLWQIGVANESGKPIRGLSMSALDRARGNHSEAARILGVTRNGLTMKMKGLGIERGKQRLTPLPPPKNTGREKGPGRWRAIIFGAPHKNLCMR